MSKDSDFVCIGHCCHDVVDDGFILGGTASYSAIVAKILGRNSSIVSSVGSDFLFLDRFKKLGIPFLSVPAQCTTVFKNVYTHEGRSQYTPFKANRIRRENVPSELHGAQILHLCAIADEIDFSIVEDFGNALIGLTIQGCLRKWDENNKVLPKAMDWKFLKGVDIVMLSKEDIKGHEHFLGSMKEYASQVVVTNGKEGAVIYSNGKEYFFPSFPVNEVEATGAGDVFSTAYLMEYERTADISLACRYAHCAASFVIEDVGLSNLPTPEILQERIALYDEKV